MRGQAFKIVAVFIILFGTMAAAVAYRLVQPESSARITYEYETLKSYLKLPPDVLDKLLHGERLTGRMSYMEALEFENRTLFKIRNTGEIPLTGFRVTFNNFVVLTEIVPFMLPPAFDGVIIVKSTGIAGKGTLIIETDQGAALRISKP